MTKTVSPAVSKKLDGWPVSDSPYKLAALHHGTDAGRARRANDAQPHVLAVDYNSAVLELLVEILERQGLYVRIACNGFQAIDLFPSDVLIRLAIFDWRLPGMTGDQVFDSLVSIRPGIRAIVISGDDLSLIKRVFAGRNIITFLQKPLNVQALIAAVRFGISA